MKIALYFDEDSQDSSLIRTLRSRGVEVIAASEGGMNGRFGRGTTSTVFRSQPGSVCYRVSELVTEAVSLRVPHGLKS